MRTKNNEDFRAAPSNKQKRIVPSEAQNRNKRLRELQVQQDFCRGFEDPEVEEHPDDTHDEETEDDDIVEVPAPEEARVQLRSARQQQRKEPEKRVLTIEIGRAHV